MRFYPNYLRRAGCLQCLKECVNADSAYAGGVYGCACEFIQCDGPKFGYLFGMIDHD